jgi:hypothetical protein
MARCKCAALVPRDVPNRWIFPSPSVPKQEGNSRIGSPVFSMPSSVPLRSSTPMSGPRRTRSSGVAWRTAREGEHLTPPWTISRVGESSRARRSLLETRESMCRAYSYLRCFFFKNGLLCAQRFPVLQLALAAVVGGAVRRDVTQTPQRPA